MIAAVALVLGPRLRAALALGAKQDERRGQQDLRAAVRQRVRPHRGRRLQGRRRARRQDDDVQGHEGRGPARSRLVEAEVTEPGLADLRKDARCEIRPQSLIGEYFVDCQPGTSRRAAPGRRPPARGADQLHDRDRPGERHHAPALSRPPAADRGRARRRPRGPPGRPQRRAPPRPSRRCARRARRCASSAARRGRSRSSSATPTRSSARSRTASRTWSASCARRARRPRSRRRGAQAAGRELPAACPPSSPSSSPTWAASATSPRRRRRCCATSSPPPASSTPSSRGCARSRRRAAGVQGARRGVRGGPPRGAEDDRRRSTSCASWRRTRRASPSRSASSSRRSTTASRAVEPDKRAARHRSARGRQDAHDLEPRRLHRHGGDLELLLLADALHERAGQRRARAAADHRS